MDSICAFLTAIQRLQEDTFTRPTIVGLVNVPEFKGKDFKTHTQMGMPIAYISILSKL